jgi:hypothetical protein
MTLFYFSLKHDSTELYCTVILHTSDIKPWLSSTVWTFLLPASLEFMTQFNALTKPLTHLYQLHAVAHHFSHSLQSSSGSHAPWIPHDITHGLHDVPHFNFAARMCLLIPCHKKCTRQIHYTCLTLITHWSSGVSGHVFRSQPSLMGMGLNHHPCSGNPFSSKKRPATLPVTHACGF